MAPKKNLKVNETENSNIIEKEDTKVSESKISKSKKKQVETTDLLEPKEKVESTPTDEKVIEEKVTKSKKKVESTPTDEKVIEEKVTKSKKKAESTPTDDKVIEEKVTKSKKKADSTSIDNKVIEDKVTKSKKKADSTPTDDKVIEEKFTISKESMTSLELDKNTEVEINNESKNIIKLNDPESYIKEKLEKTKQQWLIIVNNIKSCHLELEKLENEKNKTVSELKELLDQLQTDDSKIKKFLIDNKVSLSITKSDIIPIENSSSESEESSSETDSDEKQTLLIKKNKSKTLIKTTKGNTKNLKMINSESDSDSD